MRELPQEASNYDMPVPTSARSKIFICLTYASSFMVYGVLFPFLPLVLHEKGLSDSETTFTISASGLAALVSPLLFAHLADRMIQFRRLMPLLLIITGLSLAPVVSHVTPLVAFIAIFATYFTLVPAVALLDPFTLDFIKRTSRSSSTGTFTSYRIWGSIGFMFPAIGLTLCFGNEIIPANFIVALGMCACFASALIAYCLPANYPSSKTPELPSKEALLAALRPPLCGLFLANMVANTALALFYTVHPRFLQEIGCSTGMIGLIINLGVFAEIALMPFAGRLIRITGISNLILIAMLTIPLRLFILSTWPTMAVATATQLLHGPLVLGLVIGVPIFLQEKAKDSFRHSIQSIHTTIGLGLTRVVGPILGVAFVNSNPAGADLPGLISAISLSGALGMTSAIAFWVSKRRSHS